MLPGVLLIFAILAARAVTPDAALLLANNAPAQAIWVDSLDIRYVAQEWGQPGTGQTVDGHPLTLHGVRYPHGLGTHANSVFNIDLAGSARQFIAMVGIDDETQGAGSVDFRVIVDGKTVADSGLRRGGESPILLTADLTGGHRLTLRVDNGGDTNADDHADWAGALITLITGAITSPVAIEDVPSIAPTLAPPSPAIHGPRIVGSTPGHPFLFRIPATGQTPLIFAAEDLPAQLTLDPHTGIITGTLAQDGVNVVTLIVKGPAGEAKRKLTIVGGDRQLALTPPMGWNSWNIWGTTVDDRKMRAAADALLSSGLAQHGYQYVNLDDAWEQSGDGRDARGEILSNEKFPDLPGLAAFIHARGFKFGIYSSPGYKTCGGYCGSLNHEQQDAETFARWGIDYLKYDWCTCLDKDSRQPYRRMRAALDRCDRDIVFSLCEYGMDRVWEWGAQVGGNCWRTTDDLRDNWERLSDIGFGQDGHERYAGPGHWNDPDMLVVGQIGWGNPRPTQLTKHEQVTHLTLWCLQASPLLIGCDLTHLDPFTMDLLANDEVLEVDQDPLGKAAKRVAQRGDTEVWARPLWDGTMAVGLFNRNNGPHSVTVHWSELGLRGMQPVRDLWQHHDYGTTADAFTLEIGPHSAAMLKIGEANHNEAYLPKSR